MKMRRLGTAMLAASLFGLQWQTDANAAWFQYSANANLLIPTSSTFMGRSSIFVPDSFTINDVMVKLNIEHTWVGDLTIFLTSPQGFWMGVVGYPISMTNTISNRPIYGPNYGMEFVAGAGYNFTDKATAGLPPEPTNPTSLNDWKLPGGNYKPEDNDGFLFKDLFQGENAQGYWHLDVFDNSMDDGGRLISWQLDFNKDALYFPFIKDNDGIGWANFLTVAAKDPVKMDVTIKVYNMAGAMVGKQVLSDTDPAANGAAVQPYARVAARPSMIAGSVSSPIPVEGSLIVETSVPAIGTANTIANYFEGFSIVESAVPRSVHNFPKAFDGPNNYQVYMLVQNIYSTAQKVTVKLFGKNATSPGHGANKQYTIPAYGTLKVRPSDVAGGIDFSGSVVVYSDLSTSGDGLGRAVPAMCRYELGIEAMTIYDSTMPQSILTFPFIKDGRFGSGIGEFQNFLSVVNPNTVSATVDVALYSVAGVKRASTGPFVIPADGKATWRPSMILGTTTAPVDFEGAIVITTNVPVVGQTNSMYPGVNKYSCDAFDLLESSLVNSVLFFPKLFDNIAGDGRMYDNYISVQNHEATAKTIKIEQFNNNGTLNGTRTVNLAAYASHVYRPKDIVTDTTGTFRGSVKVTETTGKNIAGAVKYEIHQSTTATSPIDAMTLYRSMGQ